MDSMRLSGGLTEEIKGRCRSIEAVPTAFEKKEKQRCAVGEMPVDALLLFSVFASFLFSICCAASFYVQRLSR